MVDSSQGIKPLYEAPTEDSMKLLRDEEWSKFYEKELDALQWAKEFMDRYERNDRRRIRSLV